MMPIKLQGHRLPDPIPIFGSVPYDTQTLYSWESFARKAAWEQSASLATAQTQNIRGRLSNHVKISMLPRLKWPPNFPTQVDQ